MRWSGENLLDSPFRRDRHGDERSAVAIDAVKNEGTRYLDGAIRFAYCDSCVEFFEQLRPILEVIGRIHEHKAKGLGVGRNPAERVCVDDASALATAKSRRDEVRLYRRYDVFVVFDKGDQRSPARQSFYTEGPRTREQVNNGATVDRVKVLEHIEDRLANAISSRTHAFHLRRT